MPPSRFRSPKKSRAAITGDRPKPLPYPKPCDGQCLRLLHAIGRGLYIKEREHGAFSVDGLNLASSDAVPQRREGRYCDHDAGRSQTTPPETPLLLGSSVKSGRAAEDQYRSG